MRLKLLFILLIVYQRLFSITKHFFAYLLKSTPDYCFFVLSSISAFYLSIYIMLIRQIFTFLPISFWDITPLIQVISVLMYFIKLFTLFIMFDFMKIFFFYNSEQKLAILTPPLSILLPTPTPQLLFVSKHRCTYYPYSALFIEK